MVIAPDSSVAIAPWHEAHQQARAALIAATAAANDAEILSADRRALPTYRAMDVAVRFIVP